MTENLAAHLETTYGIRVAGMTRLDGGVFRVDRHDGPSWVARLFPAARPIEAVEGDAEVLRFLEQQGFAAERCAHPEPVSTLDGQGVLVSGHVDGAKPDGGVGTLRTLGDMLGRLHTLPIESGAVARDAGSLHHWSVRGGLPSEDIGAAMSWLAKAAPAVQPHDRAAFDSLRDQVAGADDCNDLPRAFIHPDFYLANAIATPDGGLVVIDWTGAGRGPRIASLALLLWLSVVRNPGGPGLGAVDAAISGYRSHVRLDPEELARLPGAVVKLSLILECFFFSIGRKALPAIVTDLSATADLAHGIAARARDAFNQS